MYPKALTEHICPPLQPILNHLPSGLTGLLYPLGLHYRQWNLWSSGLSVPWGLLEISRPTTDIQDSQNEVIPGGPVVGLTDGSFLWQPDPIFQKSPHWHELRYSGKGLIVNSKRYFFHPKHEITRVVGALVPGTETKAKYVFLIISQYHRDCDRKSKFVCREGV